MSNMKELELKILNLLDAGIGINKIAKDLKIKKSTIKEVIERNKEELAITSFSEKIENNDNTLIKSNIENKELLVNNSIDLDKLNLLLSNLDSLLKLVDRNNTTNSTTEIDLSSSNTKVTSLRINKGIYSKVKQRAEIENITISNIVNRALIDYLNNYL